MIDGPEFADVLLQEARLFGQSINYSDAPDLSPEKKFERAVAERPLPDRGTIASVLEEAFWASLLTEEGRPCRPRLHYFPRQPSASSPVHWLENVAFLNRDTLRKLTPAPGPLGYLTWDSASGKPEVTGIEGRELGNPFDLSSLHQITVHLISVGGVSAWWPFGLDDWIAFQRFRYPTSRGPSILCDRCWATLLPFFSVIQSAQ